MRFALGADVGELLVDPDARVAVADDLAQAVGAQARAPRRSIVSARWIVSACSWMSNGLTVRVQSPSSSWAPVFSESITTPSRVLTAGASLATRFMPSKIEFTTSRSNCL